MQEERMQRRGGGCRYLLIGLITFLLAAVIFVLGLVTGGGSALMDRLLGFGAPAPTPTPTIITREAIVRRIQQVSRLESTIYTVEQVVEARQTDSRWPDWLRGDKLLLIAHGRIVAGVDLATLKPEDVTVSPDGRAFTVRMPPVQIFNRNSILDNSKTRVYDRQLGLLSTPSADLESQARLAAEGALLQTACADGIMQRATDDAQQALEQLLQLFEMEVTVTPSPPGACP